MDEASPGQTYPTSAAAQSTLLPDPEQELQQIISNSIIPQPAGGGHGGLQNQAEEDDGCEGPAGFAAFLPADMKVEAHAWVRTKLGVGVWRRTAQISCVESGTHPASERDQALP